MESSSASRVVVRKHTNGWITILALSLLAAALLACLYVLIGFPAEAQELGNPESAHRPSSTASAPGSNAVVEPAAPVRHRFVAPAAAAEANPAAASALPPARSDAMADDVEAELGAAQEQLRQSQQALREASAAEHRTRAAAAIFLAVFAAIAALIIIQVYLQAKAWDADAGFAVGQVQALAVQLEEEREQRAEARSSLPALLQEVGEQPLSFQEEGNPFSPRAQAMIDDIDSLAYMGQGRLAFRDLPQPSDAAVYLNGLLLSAASHLMRSDPWTAFARLDQFFSHLAKFPDVVDRRRIAQGYSYRALAAYQVLAAQDRQPSWLRKTDQIAPDSLTRQAFADIAHANTVDPDWRHSAFVEALLCSRFYLPEKSAESGARSDLFVRGLRRAASLYRGLIEERAYRGPSRRNLAGCLKRIAEQTGEKSDFSDFGFALNAFPSDEELAEEALAARQPASQDRFLWQWMLGDEELFGRVERLNLAEYRAFWIRMLDSKIHLRNWRADLAEWQQARPEMREWPVQLLQAEPPISLSNAISRRQERFDSSASGA